MSAFLDLIEASEGSRLLEASERRVYAPGEELIGEGEPGERLIIVRSGTARVLKGHLGARVPIGRVSAGEVLGELSFVDGEGASASVVAHSELEADVLESDALRQLMADDAELGAHVYRALAITMAERLRRSDSARVSMPVLGIG